MTNEEIIEKGFAEGYIEGYIEGTNDAKSDFAEFLKETIHFLKTQPKTECILILKNEITKLEKEKENEYVGEMTTENICECGHSEFRHHKKGKCQMLGDCPCKEFTPQNHSPRKTKSERRGGDITPKVEGIQSPQNKIEQEDISKKRYSFHCDEKSLREKNKSVDTLRGSDVDVCKNCGIEKEQHCRDEFGDKEKLCSNQT